MNRVKNRGLTTAEASIEMKKAMQKEQIRTRDTAQQIDSTTSGQLEQSAVSDAINSLDVNAAKRAKTTQKKQLDKSDGLTESTVKAQQQMENMNMELQKLGFQALPYAADAVDAVSATIDTAIKFIMDTLEGKSTEDKSGWWSKVKTFVKKVFVEKQSSATKAGGKGGSGNLGTDVMLGAGGTGGSEIMAAAGTAPAQASAKPGEAAPGGAKGDLANKIMMAESGGKNIDNRSGPGGKATSTATGLFQFTKGTFEDLVKNAKTDSPLYGKTFEDYKQNTTLQYEAMNVLMEKNAGALTRRGIETTDANMYLAHFLGAGGAAKALLAGPSAPLTDVMSKEQLDANPSLKSMRTVADLQAWADKKMGGGEATPGKTREAAEGALLSGPQQGYNPNKSMAGVDIKPLNKQAMDAANSANGQAAIDPQMFGLQMEQLDLLIASARNQLAVKQRILKAKA
jgi:hypothetical protein